GFSLAFGIPACNISRTSCVEQSTHSTCGTPGDGGSPADREESPMTSSAFETSTHAKPTVVLVHGAFADSSSWNDVIARLRQDGYPVIGVANPLRTLQGDADYLRE